MTDARTALADAKRRLGDLAGAAPAAMKAMTELTRATGTAGSFTPAQKELVAVSIAVTQGCDDCILFHVDLARRHGATEADLAQALSVAIEGGGPAAMYAGKALAAWRGLA
ncbi:MAG TPA: carboxymuconolactone decarboxylase family protein [Amaricoccus sp.]|nr:carboxymuconolactone decarboxylase family protein [Amaricoccus sp.]